MRVREVVKAWSRILNGYRPALSIELTKECPLSCPGCYAFQPDHLAGAPLTSVVDSKGDELVARVLELVEARRPLVVYFVGGEPLVRFRELSEILPRVCARGIEVRVVTSAVRPIPMEWAAIANLGIVVSVDGLQPEHDERRKPATYERILEHIEGHRIVVHFTVTSQATKRPGYIEEYVDFWSRRPEVKTIEVSLFTPQVGETSPEILTPEMRQTVVSKLAELAPRYPKVFINEHILKAYLSPPRSPSECIFATVTECVSPDLRTVVEPCQFGGTPKCDECGCLGSIGLHAIGQYRLPIGVKVEALFRASTRFGEVVRRVRSAEALPAPQKLEI
jgi:MoaA/NifB/PqqE/SkfB family radical SAM enzyme